VTAEELAEKAKDQRQRGRLEEALISARHATTLDQGNANAFWQLALCQWDLNGAAKALEPLERVTELAPRFAYGWTKLGLALRKTGEDGRAKECLERAIEIEAEETAALIELASIYENDEQPDDEMRVLLALEDLVDLTPYQLNRLGILHHTKKDFYTAIRYYQRVAAEGSGPAGFFNLGLVFNEPEVAQRADAVDAWRRALEEEPGYDRAPKMIARLLPELLELRQRVTAVGGAVLSGTSTTSTHSSCCGWTMTSRSMTSTPSLCNVPKRHCCRR
jgi:tetratricopeptide (TPR) repeat protein